MLGKHLVFIGSIQSMNSGLAKLVKNLSKIDLSLHIKRFFEKF